MCICLFWLQGKGSNLVKEGDSRQAAENIDATQTEKVESTALVLSAPPTEHIARSDTVLVHPLREQMNENDRNEAEVMNCMRNVRVEIYRSKCFIWRSRILFAPTRKYTVVSNYKF